MVMVAVPNRPEVALVRRFRAYWKYVEADLQAAFLNRRVQGYEEFIVIGNVSELAVAIAIVSWRNPPKGPLQ